MCIMLEPNLRVCLLKRLLPLVLNCQFYVFLDHCEAHTTGLAAAYMALFIQYTYQHQTRFDMDLVSSSKTQIFLLFLNYFAKLIISYSKFYCSLKWLTVFQQVLGLFLLHGRINIFVIINLLSLERILTKYIYSSKKHVLSNDKLYLIKPVCHIFSQCINCKQI